MMADRGGDTRQPSGGARRTADGPLRTGGPLRARARKRWASAAAVVLLWVSLAGFTGSALAAVLVLLLAALFAGVVAVALRSLGIGRDHPAVAALATRPWRDGREVLAIALRHLPEVFVITPNGARLAPSAIDLCMNPADVGSLADVIDLDLVNASAAEAYTAEIQASGAQVRSGVPIDVSVVADPAVPAGRYALRQRRPDARPVPVGPGRDGLGPVPAGASRPGFTCLPVGPGRPGLRSVPAGAGRPALRSVPAGRQLPPTGPLAAGPASTGSVATEAVTTEAATTEAATQEGRTDGGRLAGRAAGPALVPNPLLRLVTGDSVTQTRVSGACAGRGRGTELMLPDDLTLSRVHAVLTCHFGEWRISGAGRNGVAVNGVALSGERVIHDGDVIRWGLRPDSLRSRVEIRP